jgi:hypothetical protein
MGVSNMGVSNAASILAALRSSGWTMQGTENPSGDRKDAPVRHPVLWRGFTHSGWPSRPSHHPVGMISPGTDIRFQRGPTANRSCQPKGDRAPGTEFTPTG